MVLTEPFRAAAVDGVDVAPQLLDHVDATPEPATRDHVAPAAHARLSPAGVAVVSDPSRGRGPAWA